MLYASPKEERPKQLTINRLILLPRPDLTTAWATRKATTTSNTLVFAKPAKALAGETVPVKTTAATAIVVEVRRGNAPISTARMAETNTANKCHAGVVSPAGTGEKAMASASAKGVTRLNTRRPFTVFLGPSAGISRGDILRGGVTAGLVMIADLRIWSLRSMSRPVLAR